MSKSFSNIRLFKNRNYLKMEKGNCSTCPRCPNLFAGNPGPMFYRTKEGSPQQGERRISENTQKCNESPDKGKGFRDFLSTLCLRKGNMSTALCFKPLNVKQQLFDQVVGDNVLCCKNTGNTICVHHIPWSEGKRISSFHRAGPAHKQPLQTGCICFLRDMVHIKQY